jgi:hypothetical protein
LPAHRAVFTDMIHPPACAGGTHGEGILPW